LRLVVESILLTSLKTNIRILIGILRMKAKKDIVKQTTNNVGVRSMLGGAPY